MNVAVPVSYESGVPLKIESRLLYLQGLRVALSAIVAQILTD